MKRVIDYLIESQVQYFATIGTDNRPKVRPFKFMLADNGRLIFATSNKKKVFGQMQQNAYVEICSSKPDYSWMRLKGKAVFLDDPALKGNVLEASELVKSIYKTPDNLDFEIFYLDEAVAEIADFSGNPPQVIHL